MCVLYRRVYYIHKSCLNKTGLDLRLDILDTGGSYVFPAMRSLAIKSADGFVLVCASDDPSSLEVSLFFSFYANKSFAQLFTCARTNIPAIHKWVIECLCLVQWFYCKKKEKKLFLLFLELYETKHTVHV